MCLSVSLFAPFPFFLCFHYVPFIVLLPPLLGTLLCLVIVALALEYIVFLCSPPNPKPRSQPLLFDTVKLTMVYGPCGYLNVSAPCMQNGWCTKGYPKPFQESTSTNQDGYPSYACPNDGRTFGVSVSGIGTVELDNRWIVPYNPFLSAKYNCHTNIKSVATFRTVKYCFKYIHKGPDCATLQYDRDKIKQYIDSCYIGAPEGVWRTLHFDVHKHIPSIEHLQVIFTSLRCLSLYSNVFTTGSSSETTHGRV